MNWTAYIVTSKDSVLAGELSIKKSETYYSKSKTLVLDWHFQWTTLQEEKNVIVSLFVCQLVSLFVCQLVCLFVCQLFLCLFVNWFLCLSTVLLIFNDLDFLLYFVHPLSFSLSFFLCFFASFFLTFPFFLPFLFPLFVSLNLSSLLRFFVFSFLILSFFSSSFFSSLSSISKNSHALICGQKMNHGNSFNKTGSGQFHKLSKGIKIMSMSEISGKRIYTNKPLTN